MENYTTTNIAIYGLGTETERFIKEYGGKLHIIGLIDSFRSDGELFGYPIIPITSAVKRVSLILVIARPGSCKAIAKKIGQICAKYNIQLIDIYGVDLLEEKSVKIDYSDLNADTCLLDELIKADYISFDLFDTLIMRKFINQEDFLIYLGDCFRNHGIVIPDFAFRRLKAEKELSKFHSPMLNEIYEEMLNNAKAEGISINSINISDAKKLANYMANMEFIEDRKNIIPRNAAVILLNYIVSRGKHVFIISDTYYSQEQITILLNDAKINNYNKLFLSNMYDTLKTTNLFEIYKNDTRKDKNFDNTVEDKLKSTVKYIHIGDDELADILAAERHNIQPFHVFSTSELFERLGGMGLNEYVTTYSDRIKVGLFISRILNDPYPITTSYVSNIISTSKKDSTISNKITVYTSDTLAYSFIAPIITDFVQWFVHEIKRQNVCNILLSSRDGYLIRKLIKLFNTEIDAKYFYTSRISAIRAGIINESDVAYVDSMKYSGTIEQNIQTRFGITINEHDKKIAGSKSNSLIGYTKKILSCAEQNKENYQKYISSINIKPGLIGLFDFVAKGTTQMFLQKLISTNHIKGFYFLQLEPEFMANKNLDIEPFITEQEKKTSSIFEDYYIIETVLTSPEPSVEEFDKEGHPVFNQETRQSRDIECSMKMQQGIIDYFTDYLMLVQKTKMNINKQLSMKILSIIHNISIEATDFLGSKIEDQFFNRWTEMKDEI